MKSHRRIFLKQLGFGVAGLGFASSFPFRLRAEDVSIVGLPRDTPESQGVAPANILAFLEAAGHSKHEFHSFMMVRHGRVVSEGWWTPYRAKANQMLYSLSKSFTSTAVGLAVSEGLLNVSDPVVGFFPDDLPQTVSPHLAGLRVRDLLTMSVGHAKDSSGAITKEENWVKAFLALPIENEPGSNFVYNSGATYMLSAIVQKLTGKKALDYLRPRLFEPLGVQGMAWETCPRGINTGGWGLAVPTEALAKFGQLYLQKGNWNGKQLLPTGWVEEATTFKIQQPGPKGVDLELAKKTSDWLQGYGYQFWRCRCNGFRGDGAFGQYMIVLPDHDAVIAITSETPDMQGILDLVWEHLLPAFKEQPLPADAALRSEIEKKLASLLLAVPIGQAISPTAARISGKTFTIESNQLGFTNATLRFDNSACVFVLKDAQGESAIHCGLGKWLDGETDMRGTPPKISVGNLTPLKVAASSVWKDENTLVMTWRFYETPHHDTVTCVFDGDKIKIEFLNSITQMSSSHEETRPVLHGMI